MSITNYFEENGYYLAQGVFDEATLQPLEQEFDRVVEQLQKSGENIDARWETDSMDELDGGSSSIIHTHNVHRYSAKWHAAFSNKEFLDCAEDILGPDIILHHSKLFLKPPRAGSPFPIHQDWWYFPTQKDSMIAAVIFLGDADDETGCFRVYPGSHKLGRCEDTSGLENSKLLADYPLENATPVPVKRGDVLYFSYFTLHGSMPNRSESSRKTVLVQLYSGADLVLPNEKVNHVDEQLVLRGWNHHMSREKAAI